VEREALTLPGTLQEMQSREVDVCLRHEKFDCEFGAGGDLLVGAVALPKSADVRCPDVAAEPCP